MNPQWDENPGTGDIVINGGLFQVGTEDHPFEHYFVLTLEGDDKGNDIDDIAAIPVATSLKTMALGVP